ncbi:LOW QUALITY PROTEIN: alpha-ketoglutarate-dependent dioxygenase alkB homolog 4-like [Ptychodera flava]|uniref:LOW QUALITY PROTEIN: alpha-ketoglutarate-dependent dioxygenase alkB homolog 4-like n=1 Tax=Ptychodera flava TaxID=63121 RepID=UPI003969C132
METVQRTCGCKGVRTCLVCENLRHKRNRGNVVSRYEKPSSVKYFCRLCNKAWTDQMHDTHVTSNDTDCIDFPGVCILEKFVSEAEEADIVKEMDKSQWKDSQSGRRKQDYGPKVNFKKQKVNHSTFCGLPAFSELILNRMVQHDCVEDFEVVEQCNLDYDPERGSSIDAHFDDFWLWGERLVTLNLLSDTYLTMTKPGLDFCVDIPLPRRSFLVLYGPARFEWLHAIHREAITSRRIAITFRELSTEFSRGGPRADVGNTLIEIARNFTGSVVL